jgi:hypothetical protein
MSTMFGRGAGSAAGTGEKTKNIIMIEQNQFRMGSTPGEMAYCHGEC